MFFVAGPEKLASEKASHSTSVSIKCVTSLDRVSPASHQLKVFGSNRLMEDYVDTYRQNPDKPYWCQMCNKGFQSLTGFQLHMQAHQGRKFMCTICDARFNQKVHLKTHLRGIHRAAQCIQCSEVNTVPSGPRFGLIKSANRNLLAWCEKCQLSIPSGKLYNRHVSHRHPELLPYSCHICGQGFQTKSGQHLHLQCHAECKDQSQRSAHGLHAEVSRLGPSSSFGSAVPVVWCSYCNLRLPSHKAYQKHLCEHHQEALPFRCELCGKAFYIKDHLRLHMRSHRGRVFPCDLCNSKPDFSKYNEYQFIKRKFFCVPGGLDQRKPRRHPSLQDLPTVLSPGRPTALEGKLIYCPNCPQAVTSIAEYEYHRAACSAAYMPFHCDICGKGLQTKGGLHLHMATHGDRKFFCPVCDSKFKFKHHLKNHLKCIHKLLPCSSCSQTFQSKEEYVQHIFHCK
ncbi:transcription factor hamlet-like isoform X15 [Biomphalaria pfeifferi]|uniref:Transcription factor hamlet-like isoform X15 n=1 Tax=Biomphalaria pfeifferi TaxID=112525 RepID=A0AAD8BBA9_BIOPF|nr:transcription factor hamlet-like isoform X15 [Biomphalaria pfeifferi]